jgi:2,4-dienoyl-CoA reductase-like NADH-dependent reductase (Old Yellow Enzyme family)/dihydrodipicolinate synthase/N-acetylneuraminate lyase
MDTGYVHLLSPEQRREVLRVAVETLSGQPLVAGAYVQGVDGPLIGRCRRAIEEVEAAGGTPVLFQCSELCGMPADAVEKFYREATAGSERVIAFELGRQFAPFGRVYDAETVRRVMAIAAIVGMKHSSLDRRLEWERLELRNRTRPNFKIYTGNDLAIDMVIYGSDYLLGLSSFCPEAFALRDRLWAEGDVLFYELNDLLQYLGCFAFRPPVPAYKHSAAQFLRLTGHIRDDSLGTPAELRAHVARLGVELPLDDEVAACGAAPLAGPYRLPDGFVVGNRFCAQPMEGWDGTPDGKPTELTYRRWRNFGRSGAKLIWGGEAVAVVHEGRANPRQLLLVEENVRDLAALRKALLDAHAERFGRTNDMLIGLQLTHSGRFSRPNHNDQPEPRILYRHPTLDRRLSLGPDYPVLTDAEIEDVIRRFVDNAEMAAAAGFDFVDVKHCHGYLGHELLSAHVRPGPFGGSFENRTRFLELVVSGIRRRVPELRIGVRVSAFDTPPFRAGPDGRGVPEDFPVPYRYAFGCDPAEPLRMRLDETSRLLARLEAMDVWLVNVSAGSPHYNPHIQRPALYPPSDSYLPPEDPLVGVARQIGVVAELKRQFPALALVGSAYTYLQEWLPHVAQCAVRTGAVDFVGLGRMMLSYPEMPAHVLAGRPLAADRICRTFSDCTTAPRMGLVSGCYRLDDSYGALPEAKALKAARSKRHRSRANRKEKPGKRSRAGGHHTEPSA